MGISARGMGSDRRVWHHTFLADVANDAQHRSSDSLVQWVAIVHIRDVWDAGHVRGVFADTVVAGGARAQQVQFLFLMCLHPYVTLQQRRVDQHRNQGAQCLGGQLRSTMSWGRWVQRAGDTSTAAARSVKHVRRGHWHEATTAAHHPNTTIPHLDEGDPGPPLSSLSSSESPIDDGSAKPESISCSCEAHHNTVQQDVHTEVDVKGTKAARSHDVTRLRRPYLFSHFYEITDEGWNGQWKLRVNQDRHFDDPAVAHTQTRTRHPA